MGLGCSFACIRGERHVIYAKGLRVVDSREGWSLQLGVLATSGLAPGTRCHGSQCCLVSGSPHWRLSLTAQQTREEFLRARVVGKGCRSQSCRLCEYLAGSGGLVATTLCFPMQDPS